MSDLEIVLHIPKCAGSTIEVHLDTHLGRRAFWSAKKRSRSLPLAPFGRKYKAVLPAPPEEIRAISGHYIGRSVEAHFPGRRLRRAVLMREPRALVLSWYNFRMASYRAKGWGSYPFGTHLRSLPADPMSHFLLANWLEMPWARLVRTAPSDKLARLEAALGAFDVVGDISDCDRLVADLSRRLGIPEVAEPANTAHGWEKDVAWVPLKLADLTTQDRGELDRRTVLDRLLYARAVRGEAGDGDPANAAPFLATELSRPPHELARRRARSRAS